MTARELRDKFFKEYLEAAFKTHDACEIMQAYEEYQDKLANHNIVLSHDKGYHFKEAQ